MRRIVAEAIRQLEQSGCVVLPNRTEEELVPQPCEDIVSPACKAVPLLENPLDPEGLARMKRQTTARIGVGRCGARLKTQTALALRADHANAETLFLQTWTRSFWKAWAFSRSSRPVRIKTPTSQGPI